MAVLDRIAGGDDLDFRDREHVHHFAQSLAAATDIGHGDFLTGRDKTRSAQDMAGHDGERGGGAAGEHKFTARQARGRV